jgi:hypothetical protein
MSFGGGSSGGTTTQQVTPYAPAEPALAQILSEAGTYIIKVLVQQVM